MISVKDNGAKIHPEIAEIIVIEILLGTRLLEYEVTTNGLKL